MAQKRDQLKQMIRDKLQHIRNERNDIVNYVDGLLQEANSAAETILDINSPEFFEKRPRVNSVIEKCLDKVILFSAMIPEQVVLPDGIKVEARDRRDQEFDGAPEDVKSEINVNEQVTDIVSQYSAYSLDQLSASAPDVQSETLRIAFTESSNSAMADNYQTVTRNASAHVSSLTETVTNAPNEQSAMPSTADCAADKTSPYCGEIPVENPNLNAEAAGRNEPLNSYCHTQQTSSNSNSDCDGEVTADSESPILEMETDQLHQPESDPTTQNSITVGEMLVERSSPTSISKKDENKPETCSSDPHQTTVGGEILLEDQHASTEMQVDQERTESTNDRAPFTNTSPQAGPESSSSEAQNGHDDGESGQAENEDVRDNDRISKGCVGGNERSNSPLQAAVYSEARAESPPAVSYQIHDYKCHVCKRILQSKFTYGRHIDSHKCRICSWEMRTLQQMEMHLHYFHKQPCRYICKYCGYRFRNLTRDRVAHECRSKKK